MIMCKINSHKDLALIRETNFSISIVDGIVMLSSQQENRTNTRRILPIGGNENQQRGRIME
ncbi:hypothetical protein CHS0354_001573 [Potamilus streckersoni]|uniref:Uncharacterized protein n=1 Tax=Potamilus streckersoni TaxID=2493646 RepID=A0AAE0VVR7_9BIVA|nr:hypothetical protein CHS0354_001573 [Potamilus streckersoni]